MNFLPTNEKMNGRRKSIIWNHFQKEDRENVKCNYCSRSFRVIGGSTSNLLKHFKKWHSKEPKLSIKRKVSQTPQYVLHSKTKSSRHRSLIWNHFERQDSENATCNYCTRNIRFCGGSTSNLLKHLSSQHSGVSSSCAAQNEPDAAEYISVLVDCSEEQQTGIHNETKTSDDPVVLLYDDYSSEMVNMETDSPADAKKPISQIFLRDPKRSKSVQKKEIIDELLLMFIAHDLQSFSIVDEISFRKFCHGLNPSYTVPDRKTLVEHLLSNKYSQVENNTKQLVSKAQSVMITTESWTSIDNENLMAVRAHFIDNNYEAKSTLLEVFTCSDMYINIDLTNDLQRVIYEWNLNENILLVISDGAENIKHSIINDLQWNHFDCLAYTINAIADEGLSLIEPLINKVKSVVALFTRSSIAKSKLEALQQQNGKVPKKLIQSIPTRWNSVLRMFERLLELKEEIKASEDDYDELSDEEFEVMKQLVSVLLPLDSATKSMCEKIHSTLSSVIIIINGLQQVYSRLCEDKTFSFQIKAVIQTIRKKVYEHFKDIEDNGVMLISTMLDPRFKNIGFSNEHIKEKARNLLTELLTNYIEHTRGSSTKQDPLLSEQKVENDGEFSVWNFLAEKVSQIERVEPVATNQSRAFMEIQQYLEEPILSRQENPLAWWKANESVFPNLSELVYSKFGAVCTSVTCEQLFTKNGQMLLERRNQLSADEVRQILFVRENSER